MSKIAITGAATGTATFTIESPATSTNRTLTIPDATTTIVGTDATQTLTNKSIVATQLTGTVAAARLPAGSVLQVVSTTKTDVSTLSGSGSYADIPGLSLSITPSSASNKILVMVAITYGGSGNAYGVMRLVRGATEIAIGDSAGDRIRGTSTMASNDASRPRQTNALFLDAPSTTSATTYKLQAVVQSGQSIKINTSNEDESGSTTGVRATSTITLMEIAA